MNDHPTMTFDLPAQLQGEAEKPASTKPHFIALDGLRGVAAFMVLVYHRKYYIGLGLIAHGYLAVDFFFLLSGFVIGYAYDERLRDKSLSFGRFFQARSIRLGPLVVLGAVLAAVVELVAVLNGLDLGTFSTVLREASEPRTLGSYLAALVMASLALPVPWHAVPFPINGPRWSLFFELSANFAFAALAPMLTDRRLFRALGLSVAGLGLCALVREGTGQENANILGVLGLDWNVFSLGFLRVTTLFLGGVAIFRLWSQKRLPRIKAPFWVLCLAVALLLIMPNLPGVAEVAYTLGCCLLIFPVIIIAGCQTTLSPLFQKIAGLSAALSFPLYILHIPLLEAFDFLHGTAPSHTRVTLLVEAIICCGVALAAGRFYDRPVRSWLSRRASRSVAPKPATATAAA